MVDGRKHPARVVAALCVTALGGSMFIAAPSVAKPDIPTVQSRVDSLYQQAEQASERYNDARLRLQSAHRRLGDVQTDLRRQRALVSTVRSRVAASVVAQYQGQTLTSTSQLLTASDPDAFLDQLNTVAQYDDQQSQLMTDYAAQADRLDSRRVQAKRELDAIAKTKAQLGTDKTEIDRKAAAAKKLLSALKERAAERASRSANRTATSAAAPTHVAASGRAAAAVRYALAKVGDAYVYGAAGPSAFDCSGLTMMAWAQAGVGLPHSSRAQTGSGTPVSESDLQPGDLVFYYSPVSHVGMYIGNGLIVNAENPSVGVKITGVNSMPYSGAVRPG